MDVLSVERGDEGRFELVPDLMADLVSDVLCVEQLARDPLSVAVVAKELLQETGSPEHVVCILDEHVEEPFLAGDQGKTHRFSHRGWSGVA